MSGEDRARELTEKIKGLLEEGEYAIVLMKDLGGFYVLPSEMALKAKLGELSLIDSAGPVFLSSNLLAIALDIHLKVIQKAVVKEAEETPSILGADGRPS